MNTSFTPIYEHSFKSFNDRTPKLPITVELDRTPSNIYWNIGFKCCYTHANMLKYKLPTFKEEEVRFYTKNFSEYIECKGIPLTKYIKDKESQPLEFIFTCAPNVPLDIFIQILAELPAKLGKTLVTQKGFRTGYILNWALHLDEFDKDPHVHIRGVYLGQKHNLVAGKSISYVNHQLPSRLMYRNDIKSLRVYFQRRILESLNYIYTYLQRFPDAIKAPYYYTEKEEDTFEEEPNI